MGFSFKVVQGTGTFGRPFLKAARATLAAFFICLLLSGFLGARSDEPPRRSAISLPGVPAPLNEKEMRKFRKKVDRINRRIRQDPCREFLTSHLGDDILDKVSEKLAEHQAFSGPRSTGLRALDSGIFSDKTVRLISYLTSSNDAPVARAAKYESIRTVAQLFADSDGPNGRTMFAAVANYNGNPNTAFYRSLNSVELIHEILHVATDLRDDPLAVKLGIDITPFDGDSDQASNAITKALKTNRCD